MLLSAGIHESPRSVAFNSSIVSVYEGDRTLCTCNRGRRRTTFREDRWRIGILRDAQWSVGAAEK